MFTGRLIETSMAAELDAWFMNLKRKYKHYFCSYKAVLSVLILLLSIPCLSRAQDKSNKLNFNVQSNFFIVKNRNQDNSFNLLNPGGEILFELGLTKKISLLTGANYIYSTRNISIGVKSSFKDIAHEIFIPILFKSKVSNRIYLTLGIYPGWFVKGKELYRDNTTPTGRRNWKDVSKYLDFSSLPKFSTDLFLGTGYIHPLINKQSIQFVPFIKYKLTDNWMEKYRTRVSFGVKINYSVKI